MTDHRPKINVANDVKDSHARLKQERRDAAADWWVRLDAGALSPAELTAFRAWLAQHPENERVFEEVCDLWGASENLRRRYLSSRSATRGSEPQRRWMLQLAAVTLALLAVVFTYDSLWIMLRADFRTGTGEMKTVSLPDGSRAHLNADSALMLDYAGNQRRISMLTGEVLFEVEKDASRPFMVDAGGGTITARGTAFAVSTGRVRTEVTVTEHSVEVESKGQTVAVATGQQTAFGPSLPALPAYSVDADSITAWRRGRLIFKDQPLREVLASIGRFHRGMVIVADKALRDRRISGVFLADKPLDAIRTIEKSLGLRATRLTDFLIFLYM